MQEELVPIFALEKGQIEERPIHIEENCGGWSLILRKDPDTSPLVYFKGSDHIYIEFDGDETDVEMSDGKVGNKDQVIYLENFTSEDSIDYEFFRKKALKHKVDLRIFTWAPKNDWAYFITLYRNGTMEESTRKYADWLWESPLLNYR